MDEIEPKLIFVSSALDDMVDEIIDHGIETETSWGLLGIRLPKRTVIVTNVVRPTPSSVTRSFATTTIGGYQMVQAIKWLNANEKLVKKLGIMPEGGVFDFLFYGHKHPQGYEHYSSTDDHSIVEAVKMGLPVAVGPLATIGQWKKVRNAVASPSTIVITQINKVNLKFYYLDREMVDAAKARFATPAAKVVTAEIVDSNPIAVMPPLGWHLSNQNHYTEQLRHLAAMGCTVDEKIREIHKGPPVEIQLLVEKPSWQGTTLSIITDWDFPSSEPEFSLIGSSGVKKLNNKDLGWSPEKDFIEVVLFLQQKGDLKQ